jgi:hypothetical protein
VNGLLVPFGAAPAKKGRFHERNQYFPRSAHRAVHHPAAPPDAPTEAAVSRVSITKDVPFLRIDHISTETPLLGMRQTFYPDSELNVKEMNRAGIRS